MSEVAGHSAGPLAKQQLAGPPLLAKAGAVIGLVVAVFAVVSLNTVNIALGVLGLLAAFKLSRVGVAVEGGELVIQNLLHSKRLNLQTSFLHHGKTDLRLRGGGMQAASGALIPRSADDNNRYDAKVLKITDSSTNETFVIDASFGRTPPAQAKFFETLEASLSAAKELPGETS